MKLPALEKTLRIAFGFVLVALIVSRPFFQVAVRIATLSGGAGGPGVSVIVVVRVMRGVARRELDVRAFGRRAGERHGPRRGAAAGERRWPWRRR
jgi:hypothetical protein